MQTIWKFEFNVDDGPIQVPMPRGAKILSCNTQQSGLICVWAEVDPHNTTEIYLFWVRGTGQITGDLPFTSEFLATVLDGNFVWHVFVSLPAGSPRLGSR